MKNSILYILLLSWSIVSTVALAENEVPAPDAPAASMPAPEKAAEADADSSESRIIIDFDDEGLEGDVNEALRKLDETLGTSLSSQFSELEEHEKEKLHEVFSGSDVNFGHHGGLGGGEFVIAVLAICLSLGLPVIILLLVFIFGHRKRKQKLQLISSYLEAGQTVPDHVLAEFSGAAGTNSQFNSGLRLALIGVAFILAFLILGEKDVAAFGLIPLAIGAAKLISWKVEGKQTNAS